MFVTPNPPQGLSACSKKPTSGSTLSVCQGAPPEASTDALREKTLIDAKGSAMKQHAPLSYACFLCLWCSFLAPGEPVSTLHSNVPK